MHRIVPLIRAGAFTEIAMMKGTEIAITKGTGFSPYIKAAKSAGL